MSGYLADVVEPGDELEVRGPIGGWFVWDGETPALLRGRRLRRRPVRRRCCGTPATLGREDLLRIAVSSRTWPGCPTPTS